MRGEETKEEGDRTDGTGERREERRGKQMSVKKR